MSLLQSIQLWARDTFHLDAPEMERIPDDPISEVSEVIARGRKSRNEFLQELSQHEERADVARALLRARERATMP